MDFLTTLDFTSLTTLVLTIFTLYYVWYFTKLRRCGIPGPIPLPVIGNLYWQLKQGFTVTDAFWEKKYGKIYGVYSGHNLNVMVTDTDFLKEVMVKNFKSFVDRRSGHAPHLLRKFLFFSSGQDWRRTRNIMTPAFSGGKLRWMLTEINRCAKTLSNKFVKTANTGEIINVKDYFSSYTCDVIARTAFGLDVDSQSDPDDEPFARHLKLLTRPPPSYFGRIPFILAAIFPSVGKFLPLLGISAISMEAVDYFIKTAQAIIEDRRKYSAEHADFIQLLLDARFDETLVAEDDGGKKPVDESKHVLSTDEITGNIIGFFAAGYETTASLLRYASYVLALHPDVDRKLVEEIRHTVKGVEPTYEELGQLKYLDQFVNETLRLYPPVSRTNREVNKEVHYNGMTIPKESAVIIPIYQIQHDPKNFPDPETFDPERFSAKNKPSIQPTAFLSFGLGPRHCIGKRLGLEEVKIALIHILRKVRFTTCKETQIPLETRQIHSFLHPLKEVKLTAECRQ